MDRAPCSKERLGLRLKVGSVRAQNNISRWDLISGHHADFCAFDHLLLLALKQDTVQTSSAFSFCINWNTIGSFCVGDA